MAKFLTSVATVAAFLASVAVARADVTVTNKTPGTIEVQVDSGKKTEIKNNEKVVFNKSGEAKVTVYSGGTEKATTTVKNNSKVVVEHRNGVWTIKSE